MVRTGLLISMGALLTLPVAQAADKAVAGTPQICSTLEAAVNSNEKEISAQTNDEILEDSAPRAMVEEAKIAAAYQAIQTNLSLMNLHRCQPYSHAITPGSYLNDALQCKTDSLRASIGRSSDVPASCDRSKWTRIN